MNLVVQNQNKISFDGGKSYVYVRDHWWVVWSEFCDMIFPYAVAEGGNRWDTFNAAIFKYHEETGDWPILCNEGDIELR